MLEQESHVYQLETHHAIIGFIKSSKSCTHIEDFHQSWHTQLLSSVLGFPVNTLPGRLCQHCCNGEPVDLMDKLDLIEYIHFPLAQMRFELEAVFKENVDSVQKKTRMFELEFNSFLSKLEQTASQFQDVLSSLFSLSDSSGVPLCQVIQALRQRVLWINPDLLAAIISFYGATIVPLNHKERDAVTICLQRDDNQSTSVILCAAPVSSPISVLHWYEHQMVQSALSSVNFTRVNLSSNSAFFNNTHQWVPNCFRRCDWY